MSMKNSN